MTIDLGVKKMIVLVNVALSALPIVAYNPLGGKTKAEHRVVRRLVTSDRKANMARSFRITSINGPEGIGPINLHYQFYVDFEYDPGESFEKKSGGVVVRLRDAEANTIAVGTVENSPFREIAIARVSFLVTQRLLSLLSSLTPELRQLITPSHDEIKNLLTVDPDRVQSGDWVQIPSEVT